MEDIRIFCENDGAYHKVPIGTSLESLSDNTFRKVYDEKSGTDIPVLAALVAVWSAPNYCYRCGNIASIMEVDEYLQSTFKTFDAAPQSERKEPSKNLPPDYFL